MGKNDLKNFQITITESVVSACGHLTTRYSCCRIKLTEAKWLKRVKLHGI